MVYNNNRISAIWFFKRTYLNVGVNFHWYSNDFWSFDYGNYRESSFVEFLNELQFIPEIEKMAKTALDKTLFYRNLLIPIDVARHALLKQPFNSDDLWGNYHKGVICGLTGDMKSSEYYFNALLSIEDNYDWANKLKERVLLLKLALNEPEKFKQDILAIIRETRKLKN